MKKRVYSKKIGGESTDKSREINYSTPTHRVITSLFSKPFFNVADSEEVTARKKSFSWAVTVVNSLICGCTLGIFAADGNALAQLISSLLMAGVIFTGLAYCTFGPKGLALMSQIKALETRVQLGTSTDLTEDLNRLVWLYKSSGNTAKADEYSRKLLSLLEE